MEKYNYKNNSNAAKRKQQEEIPEKKVEKIVSGNVKTKKKSEVRKFADVFVSEDVNNVKSYIFMDVFVPAIKKLFSDVVTNTVDMLLYGESGSRKKSTASKISYGSFYDGPSRRPAESRQRVGYNYDDIIIDNRGEAEEVLTRMDELVSTYGMVSVADLYDIVGITPNYTDNKYGWTDIRSATVVRARGGGYMIKLPRALPFN